MCDINVVIGGPSFATSCRAPIICPILNDPPKNQSLDLVHRQRISGHCCYLPIIFVWFWFPMYGMRVQFHPHHNHGNSQNIPSVPLPPVVWVPGISEITRPGGQYGQGRSSSRDTEGVGFEKGFQGNFDWVNIETGKFANHFWLAKI